jgi:ABC-type multidrug transport system ATPase subunit
MTGTLSDPLVLRYRRDDGSWQDFPLGKTEIVLGRGAECDLRLEDADVSRRHAILSVEHGALRLTDLGSTNGTQVAGKPLPPRRETPLAPGEQFTMGPFTLVVETIAQRAPGRAAVTEPPVALQPVSESRQDPQAEQLAPANLTMVVPLSPAADAGVSANDRTILAAGPSDRRTEDGVPLRILQVGEAERVSIGRANDNNMVLDHPLVSRYHALLERMGGRFRLKDLQSSNGVFVNGTRIDGEAWLREGDLGQPTEIRIGPYSLLLSSQGLQMQVEAGLGIEAIGLRQEVSKQVNLLQDISLSIKPQEFVALVGMSGAGKSTLLHALNGYRPATHGQVLVNGTDLYQHYDLFRNEIGYVPQKDIVHMELTPASALGFAAQLRMPPDTGAAERSRRVTEVLTELGLLERKDVPIARLSGGQLKRVSIGVELLTKPRLFFLDEPTSGLDPGTEYDMMKLMRRLADQGRTVILVTHATKNVMLCDKVIFLARGGHMAYFGPPEEALDYFDQYRTPRERREKVMEFDDIYRILSDPQRGSPAEWGERFRSSPDYRPPIRPSRSEGTRAPPPVDGGQRTTQAAGISTDATGTGQEAEGPEPAKEGRRTRPQVPSKPRVYPLRQLRVLSARNLKIILQDKLSLVLMLALAPVLGVLDFVYGPNLFDPVRGDAAKTMTVWFMAAVTGVLVGALGGVREIVKEVDIYRRERVVNLQIWPYVLSKVWVGLALALYQAGVLLLFRVIFVQPRVPGPESYLAMYITMFLVILCGYAVGLAISAATSNQNAALLLIVAVLVPQFLFAGALLPLDIVPGGEQVSMVMPTRWAFESFVDSTGMGKTLAGDTCWALPKDQRRQLTDAQKAQCTCMGANLFTRCANFPGILSPDIYGPQAQAALTQGDLKEPVQPTPLPSPTFLPTPRPLNTPTALAAPTPLPQPADPTQFSSYIAVSQGQVRDYQQSLFGQLTEYVQAGQDQLLKYVNARQAQGDEYGQTLQAQGQEFAGQIRAFGVTRADQEKAIGSAEAILGTIYDNFGRAFRGGLAERWLAMVAIILVLLGLVLGLQKLKDVVR